MKYCEEYAALLDLFVDGELAPEELERVQAHLETCPGCRAYVDDALAIRAAFPDVEDTPVPEGFAEGVMERVRKVAEKDHKIIELRRRSFRRWAGTLAGLAACCALVVILRSSPSGDAHVPPRASYAVGCNPESVEAPAAYDTSGAEENGVMSRMTGLQTEEAAQASEAAAPAEAPSGEEAAAENQVTAAYSADMEKSRGDTAGASEYGDLVMAAPALKMPAEDETDAADAVEGKEKGAALYLTAEEAGDLLKGFSAAWENAVEWGYELNAEDYRALLEVLGRQEELPETEEGPFLVVVTGPLE